MSDPIDLIRHVLAINWDIPEGKLVDEFCWADELGPEDGGWFLAEVNDHYPGLQLFKSNFSADDLSKIGTIRQLADHVIAVMRSYGADHW